MAIIITIIVVTIFIFDFPTSRPHSALAAQADQPAAVRRGLLSALSRVLGPHRGLLALQGLFLTNERRKPLILLLLWNHWITCFAGWAVTYNHFNAHDLSVSLSVCVCVSLSLCLSQTHREAHI
jgi:hypothetical protein